MSNLREFAVLGGLAQNIKDILVLIGINHITGSVSAVMAYVERLIAFGGIAASEIRCRIESEHSCILLKLRFTDSLAIQLLRALNAPNSKNCHKDS